MTNDRRFRGKESFPIPVWNGMLEHRKRLGSAVWEFLWCLDHITAEKNGKGLVHGGAPVKAGFIATALGVNLSTSKRNMRRLVAEGYITCLRTSFGNVITVLNSLKFGAWGIRKRRAKNAPDEEAEMHPGGGGSAPSEGAETPLTKKTAQLDNATDTVLKDGFEMFWKVYPKKVAKPAALKAWKKIPPGHLPEILDGVRRFTQSEQWQGEGGRFIPYPATFLNQRRWEDELGPVASSPEPEMVRLEVPA